MRLGLTALQEVPQGHCDNPLVRAAVRPCNGFAVAPAFGMIQAPATVPQYSPNFRQSSRSVPAPAHLGYVHAQPPMYAGASHAYEDAKVDRGPGGARGGGGGAAVRARAVTLGSGVEVRVGLNSMQELVAEQRRLARRGLPTVAWLRHFAAKAAVIAAATHHLVLVPLIAKPCFLPPPAPPAA